MMRTEKGPGVAYKMRHRRAPRSPGARRRTSARREDPFIDGVVRCERASPTPFAMSAPRADAHGVRLEKPTFASR